MTLLKNSNARAKYGRKIGTSGMVVPRIVLTYPPDDTTVAAVGVL
jgi:hypothetical protein